MMKYTARRTLLALMLTATTLLFAAAPASGCPNCKATIADEPVATDSAATPIRRAGQGQSAAAGYNYSIFVMLGALYLTVGSFVGAGVYYIRKHSSNVNRT